MNIQELVLTIPGASNLPTQIPVPTGVQTYSISSLLSFGATAAIVFAIVLSLIFLILGGIDLITGGGEKQKIQNGKQKLIYAVIGLIVVLLSFLIITVVGDLFGVQLFGFTYDSSVRCRLVAPGEDC